MVHDPKKSYFLTRINQLGLDPKTASFHGIGADSYGNILINVRNFDGETIRYIPKSKRKQYEAIKNRNALSGDEDQLMVPLQSKRLHPDSLRKMLMDNPDKKPPKYLIPNKEESGFGAMPMPNNEFIKRKNVRIDNLVITEGYFKAVALSQMNVPTIAFDGVLNFKIQGDFLDFLIKSDVKKIVLLYDGDVNEVRIDKEGYFNNGRENTFKLSIERFARQLFNVNTRYGTNIKLSVSIPKFDDPKGIDDLLCVSTQTEKESIINELESGIGKDYFTFYKIGKTTIQRELNSIFGGNYQEWYHRYKSTIGNQPFKYNNVKYQLSHPDIEGENLFDTNSQSYFRLVENPFSFSIESEKQKEFPITEYMIEQSEQIDSIISENRMIAIDSPTGSGKTSFFCGSKKLLGKTQSYFRRNPNELGVIAVPTRSICKQISKEHGIVAVYGNNISLYGSKRHQLIVCTYDTINHIKDIEDRILIIDEAHKLVDDFGNGKTGHLFRASALRNLLSKTEIAKKTVLLSGTMPMSLIYSHKLFYVKLKRKKTNKVHIYQVNTDKQNNNGFLKTTINHLVNMRNNRKKELIDVVFWNNHEQLMEIKNHLINQQKWKESDISIISRKDIDSSEHKVYQNIIDNQMIKGVKLVLTTCIIGEGINIKNNDIGSVIMVNNYCTNTAIQFIARFRKMDVLNLHDIKHQEKDVAKGFRKNSKHRIHLLQKTAEIQQQDLQDEIKGYCYDFDPDELEFAGEIYELQYEYISTDISPNVYVDNNVAKIDHLRILNIEKQRQLETMNNSAFYTELMQYDGIHYKGIATLNQGVEIDVKPIDREPIKKQLKAELIRNPESVISGLYHFYMEKKNAHGICDLDQKVPDLVNGTSEFYDANKHLFNYKWYRFNIRQYAFLHFIGMDKDSIASYMNESSEAQFGLDVQKWKFAMGIEMYKNRHYRSRMNVKHKLDMRDYNKFIIQVRKLENGKRLNSIQLQRKINDAFQNAYQLKNKEKDPYWENKEKIKPQKVYWDEKMIHKYITLFFECDWVQFIGYREYNIYSLTTNPFISTQKGNDLKFFADYLTESGFQHIV